MTRKPTNFTHRPGAAHDVFTRHQPRPMPSDILFKTLGDAAMAAIRAAEARKTIEVFQRIAARDCAAGRPASLLLAERLRGARRALVEAEHALAALKARPRQVVDADEDADG